jgi:hypothetical protein
LACNNYLKVEWLDGDYKYFLKRINMDLFENIPLSKKKRAGKPRPKKFHM